MRIAIATDPTAVTLLHPDDFTAFSVEAPAGSGDDLADRLGHLGRLDGDHVWIDRDALVDLAGARASDPDWRGGLDAMVDYARANGFLSDDGTAIRAHIEWAPADEA